MEVVLLNFIFFLLTMRIVKLVELYDEAAETEPTEEKPGYGSLKVSYEDYFEEPLFSYRSRSETYFQDTQVIEKSLEEAQEKRKKENKRRSSCKPRLQKITEEVSAIKLNDNEGDREERDFAAIHRERALSCGAIPDDLRRFRRKKSVVERRGRSKSWSQ